MYELSRGLLAAVLFAAPAVAMADEVPSNDVGNARQGWYSTIGGGFNFLDKSRINGGGFGNKASFENGWLGTGALGYGFGNLRVEGEAGYRRNEVDHLNNSAAGGGHATGLDFMGNVYYDLFPKNRIDPYVGVGAGAARDNFSKISSGGPVLVNDDDWRPAYQGIAGVRYLVAPQWDLGAEYRYFATWDPHFTTTANSVPPNQNVEGRDHNNSLLMNVTYHFDNPSR